MRKSQITNSGQRSRIHALRNNIRIPVSYPLLIPPPLRGSIKVRVVGTQIIGNCLEFDIWDL